MDGHSFSNGQSRTHAALHLDLSPPPHPPFPSSQAPEPPHMQLSRINAFTGEFTRVLTWAPNSDEVVFAAASVIVAMRVGGGGGSGSGSATTATAADSDGAHHPQRFFFGHTAHVCAFAFDHEGGILASVQEGKQAVVRVWDFRTGLCAAVLNGEGGSARRERKYLGGQEGMADGVGRVEQKAGQVGWGKA